MAADIFKCVICNLSDCEENLTKLTKKGCDSIKISGEARGDNLKLNNCGESFVHANCRKNYVSKHKIAQFQKKQQSSTTTTDCDSDRSRITLNQHCVFCGFKLSLNKDKENICVIKTTAFQESIVKICHERNDEWATEVLSKIEGIVDCLATGMKYHINCSINFRKKKQKPLIYTSMSVEHGIGIKRKSVGNPVNEELLSAFNKTLQLCEEKEKELFTISEMCKTMTSFCGESYSKVYMKKKVMERYGNGITITTRVGEEDLISFSSSIQHIVEAFYSQQCPSNFEEKKIGILKTAAKILLHDIGKIETNKDNYDIFGKLSSYEEALCFVPVSLQIFCSTLITSQTNKKKIPSVAQSLMQLAFPRKITCPLQVIILIFQNVIERNITFMYI